MQRRWVGNVLLVIGSVIIAIALMELGLRAADISYPSFYKYDEHRGAALRPGAEGRWRGEGEAYIRINSDGLRDREHTKKKPGDTVRIAVLGDSYAEALQVGMEKTFWAVLERALAVCDRLGGRKVEVVNFGVSGYGTAQELLTLRHVTWQYEPDIIVLAFFTGNDVQNNYRTLEHDPMRPYFVLEGDTIVLDRSYLRSPQYRARQTWVAQLLYGLINHSRLLQLINQAKNIANNYFVERRRYRNARATDATQSEAGLNDNVFRKPKSHVWNEAWEITERLLIMMRDEVQERSAKFLVASRELRKAMGVAGKQQVTKYFQISRCVADYTRLYSGLLLNKRTRVQELISASRR